jgi:hypothetical protein
MILYRKNKGKNNRREDTEGINSPLVYYYYPLRPQWLIYKFRRVYEK